MYLRWICYFPFAIIITIFCWISNPIVCLFPVYENYRARLWGFLDLWSTYDNFVDEYYFGSYGTDKPTLTQYNRSSWIRYKYRVLWLSRNTGYGFSYKFLSIPKGTGFQWKGQASFKNPFLIAATLLVSTLALASFLPLFSSIGFSVSITAYLATYYINDFNIGWKSHKGFDRDDYAARIIGLRKAK